MMKIIHFGIILSLSLICVQAKKIRDRSNNNEGAGISENNGTTDLELAQLATDVFSPRTFEMMDSMKNHFSDAMKNMTWLWHGMGDDKDIFALHKNATKNGTLCGDPFLPGWSAVAIPIFFIAPAVVLGVIILIKIIGLVTAWIPSVSSKFFQSFMHSDTSDDSDSGYGYPPSPSYGAPPSAPSSYGSPSLSRQTAILESIDNLGKIYGSSQIQAQPGYPAYYPTAPENDQGQILPQASDTNNQKSNYAYWLNQQGQQVDNSSPIDNLDSSNNRN